MDPGSELPNTNEVPEFLNELIPYRCPKCGHARRFSTLRDLRHHLQRDHAYKMSCVRPNPRTSIFNSPRAVATESADIRYQDDKGNNLPDTKYRINKANYYIRDEREASPLLQSFKDETALLEMELQKAKQTEMAHKATSFHNLSSSSINIDFRSSLDNIHTCSEPKTKRDKLQFQQLPLPTLKTTTPHYPNFASVASSTDVWRFPSPVLDGPFTNVSYSNETFQQNLKNEHPFDIPVYSSSESLNAEVMKSRLQQWATADALYETQDLLKRMEQEAEDKCKQQREIIEQLVQDIRRKDEHLHTSAVDHARLREERERLLTETESLTKRADEYNNNVKEELHNRDQALASVNKELGRLRELSEKEMKAKDNDVLKARETVQRLEWERDTLVKETGRLLQQADADRTLLTRTVKQKETELHDVNMSLKQLQSNQEAMLQKTMAVYRNAEESRQAMKVAIDTKEGQLHHAMQQIDAMKTLHHRLVEQSRVLSDQADENTASMQRLLVVKVDQIHDLATQLEMLKEEKHRLQENSVSLAEKAESTSTIVDGLKETVKAKEKELKVTQIELQSLKTYLKNTADKERTARDKLEEFIEDLIRRAERAEEELRVLKSQSSSSTTTKADSIGCSTLPVNKTDASERQTLPDKIPPVKPQRTKLVKNDQDSTTPAWRSGINILPYFEPLDLDSSGRLLSSTMEVQTVSNKGYYNRLRAPSLPRNKAATATNNSNSSLPDRLRRSRSTYTGINNRENVGLELETDSDTANHSFEENVKNRSPRHSKHRKTKRTNDRNRSKRKTRTKSVDSRAYSAADLETESDDKYDELDGSTISDSECYNRRSKNHRRRSDLSSPRPSPVQGEKTNRRRDNSRRKDSDADDDTLSATGSNAKMEHGSHTEIKKERRPTSVGHSLSTESERTITPREDEGLTNQELSEHRKPTRTHEKEDAKRSDKTFPTTSLGLQTNTTKPDELKGQTGVQKSKDQGDDQDINDVVPEIWDNELTDGLDNLMDENGILWDDMDTLPDVSDAELDRVSPSGSEAIATKNTTATVTGLPTTVIGPQNVYSKQTPVKNILAHSHGLKYADPEPGIKLIKTAEKHNNNTLSEDCFKHYNSPSLPNPRAVLVNTVQTNSKNMLYTEILDNNKTEKSSFRPIKSPTGNGSSVSDKDVTSGGREVHQFMRVSPQIDIYGSDGNSCEATFSSRPDHYKLDKPSSALSKGKYDTETVRDKVKRISEKYSTKRDKNKGDSDSSISDKIQSINEKYKAQRQNILKGKGLGSNSFSPQNSTAPFGASLTDSRPRSTDLPPHRRNLLSATDKTTSGQFSYTTEPIFKDLNSVRTVKEPESRQVMTLETNQSAFLTDNVHKQHPNQLPAVTGSQVLPTYATKQNTAATKTGIPSTWERFETPTHSVVNKAIDVSQHQEINVKVNGNSRQEVKTLTKNESQANSDTLNFPKASDMRIGQTELCGENISEKTENVKDVSQPKEDYVDISSIGDYQRLLDDDMEDDEKEIESNEVYNTSFEEKLEEHLDLSLKSTPPTSDDKTNSTKGDLLKMKQTELLSATIDEVDDDKGDGNMSLFEDVDHSDKSYTLSKPLASAFAAELDDLSVGYDTNSQSYIDLPGGYGSLTDTDLDTDTEVVKRQFYNDTNKIKSILNSVEHRPEVQERQIYKQTRHTASSASSQASFEILETLPASIRQATRRRRAALVRIFSFLDMTSLCRASQVCREWRLVCRSPNLWKVVKVENVNVNEHFLAYLARRCSKLRILILKDLRLRKPFDELDANSLSQIRSTLESGFELLTKKAESTLHTVAIVNCGPLFSAKCLWTASCSCRMLRHVTYLSNHDSITSEVMWALGSGCRDLKSLKVHPILPNPRCEQFTTRCVQMIGQCFQDLSLLSIGGKHIDTNALVFVAKRCQKLESLELHNMNFVTCELMDACCTSGLKSLKYVRFLTTPVAPGCILLLQENCGQLKTLEIVLKESDHCVGDQDSVSVPEYSELVEGYQAFQKQRSMFGVLLLDVAKPEPKQTVKPAEEKSFFQKLFG